MKLPWYFCLTRGLRKPSGKGESYFISFQYIDLHCWRDDSNYAIWGFDIQEAYAPEFAFVLLSSRIHSPLIWMSISNTGTAIRELACHYFLLLLPSFELKTAGKCKNMRNRKAEKSNPISQNEKKINKQKLWLLIHYKEMDTFYSSLYLHGWFPTRSLHHSSRNPRQFEPWPWTRRWFPASAHPLSSCWSESSTLCSSAPAGSGDEEWVRREVSILNWTNSLSQMDGEVEEEKSWNHRFILKAE